MSKEMVTVIVEGLQRIRILAVDRTGPCFVAQVEPIPKPGGLDDELLLRRTEALKASAHLLNRGDAGAPQGGKRSRRCNRAPGAAGGRPRQPARRPCRGQAEVLETIPLAARVELVLEQVNQERARRA